MDRGVGNSEKPKENKVADAIIESADFSLTDFLFNLFASAVMGLFKKVFKIIKRLFFWIFNLFRIKR